MAVASILVLITVTLLYTAYNVLAKLSSNHVPDYASTPVLATLCLQASSMIASLCVLGVTALRGGAKFSLTPKAYIYAAAAGFCIGFVDIGVFFLFTGFGKTPPMDIGIVVPTLKAGTIVLVMFFSAFVFKEILKWPQWLGAALIVTGIVLLFVKTDATPAATSVV